MIKLILTNGEKVNQRLMDIMKKSTKNLIVVLSAKSYSSLEKGIGLGCKKKKCFFIDTVSNASTKENVLYVPPANLTGLSIAINQAQQPFEKNVCVIFDSFLSLSLQNDTKTLTRFVSFILGRATEWNVDLTFILPTGPDNELINLLKQSADKVEVK